MLIPLFLLLASCALSPTGRKQLIILDNGQMNAMGVDSFNQMKSKTPVERNSSINGYVKCVVNHILLVARDTTGVQSWETVVFKDDSANAFALPGGRIGVHTGLLKIEVGHVLARHGNERVSSGLVTQFGLAGAQAILDKNVQNDDTRKIVMSGLGLGAQFGVMLPYGRSHESEADLIGLRLMAKAGFDPRQSVHLWQKVGAASGGKGPPEFMSTHPSHTTRIANLQAKMGEALGYYNATKNRPRCQ
jgi:predicted Zn-dependent protease